MAYDPTTRAGGWVTARSQRYIVLAVGGAFGIGGVLLALLASGAPGPVVLSASAIGLLVLKFVLPKYGDLAERFRKGSVAEQAVGAVLDELRRDGFVMLHDVEDPRGGNIDHIVNGPTGLYLIETKFRRYEPTHLGKARGQARWLHDQLGTWATPVICLATRRGRPWTHKGVSIVPLDHLADWIRQQHNQPADFERLARFADGLQA